MRLLKIIILAVFLLSLAGCLSLRESVGEALITPILIGIELFPIVEVSKAYKDSTNHWPNKREDLQNFISINENSSEADSLYKLFQTKDRKFEKLHFSENQDTLFIDFVSYPLPDTTILRKSNLNKPSQYFKYVGKVLVAPDTSETFGYSLNLYLDDLFFYDSKMIYIGNMIQ